MVTVEYKATDKKALDVLWSLTVGYCNWPLIQARQKIQPKCVRVADGKDLLASFDGYAFTRIQLVSWAARRTGVICAIVLESPPGLRGRLLRRALSILNSCTGQI